MVDAVLATAAAWGCHAIWLETAVGVMDAAITVYRRHGFTVTDRPADIPVAGVIVMNRAVGSSVRCA